MAREINQYNRYKDRLLKLIPSEIVAAYLVIEGMIPSGETHAPLVSLIAVLVLLILIPFYLNKTMNVKRTGQIILTMVSFIIWIYSLGGPFALYGVHIGYVGSVLLVLWTLVIPLMYRPITTDQ
jgi:hypothetical protein